jgi:hypothetical protein
MVKAKRTRAAGVPALLATVGLLVVVGCSADPTVNTMLGPQAYGGRYQGGTATGDTAEGASFAQRVIQQDPTQRYITGAIVRNDDTLGVKVQPNVSRGDLERLLASLTEGMARTFPGRPVRTIAFYQSGDKLAEADFDPRSGRVNVGFAR